MNIKTFALTTFLSLLSLPRILTFNCGHNILASRIKPKPLPSTSSPTLRNLTSTTPNMQPIAFYIDETYANQQTDVNADVKEFTLDSLKKATELFTTLLKVQRVPTIALTIDNIEACEIPDSAYNPELLTGIDGYDVIIFPSFQNLPEGVEASATYCASDQTSKRPVAGVIHFNRAFPLTKHNAKDYQIMLHFHELTHVLVFNVELIKNQFNGTSNAFRVITGTINGQSRYLLATPKVVAAARKHFNCSTLQGVELENQGGEGTMHNHWESRVMLGDYMIGFEYGESVISEITLALFEDSGWYQVNGLYTGGLFRFGKGKGCEFINKTCITASTTSNTVDAKKTNNSASSITFVSNSGNEYCTRRGHSMCLPGRTSTALCYIKDYVSSIPAAFRYFGNATCGGYEPTDFCPVPYVNIDDEYFYPTHCNTGKGTSTIPPSLGFTLSDTSICVMSTLTLKGRTDQYAFRNVQRAMCHEIECDTTNKQVVITVRDYKIKCPTQGGKTTHEAFDGAVLCPDYNLVCTGSMFCTDPISCVNKKSVPLESTFTYDYVANNTQEMTIEAMNSGGNALYMKYYCFVVIVVGLLCLIK